MPAKAYIKNRLIHLLFEGAGGAGDTAGTAVIYNAGASLAGFLRVDTEEISRQYDEIIRSVLNLKGGRLTPEREQWLLEAEKKINNKSPYLKYYTDILTGVLISIAKGKLYDMSFAFASLPKTNELYERYNARFEEDVKNADAILSPYYPADYLESRPAQQKAMMLRSINSILYIKEAIMLDIDEKKKLLDGLLSSMYNNDFDGLGGSDAASLTKSQRLLLFDMSASAAQGSSPFFINRELTMRSALFSNGMPITEDFPPTAEYVSQNELDTYELYTVDWADDLIRLELLKAIELNAVIKKCANCGRLFAPSGRADTIYCGSIYEDTGKTCAEIGAIKKYKDKAGADPVLEAFNKAYKRNNSRMRNGRMTKQEFKEWLELAKAKRGACINGEIGIEEFSGWLGNR